jgi:hypothetical protein
MSGKDQLQFSTSQPQDAYYTKPEFASPSDSLFYYMGWVTKTNFAQRRRQLTAYGTQAAYGSTVTFRFDKSAFKRGPVQLRWTRSALTGTGGATFQRFVDFEGYASIANIDVYHGQNRLFTITGDLMQILHRLMKDQRQSDAANMLVFGDQSVADRNTLAAASATLTVDLPLWWTYDPTLYFISTGTAHELEIRVTMRPLAEITQTDGTSAPTGSITNMYLLPLDVHVEDDEKGVHHAAIESKTGIHYMIQDYEYHTNIQLASGNTQYQIQLTNFKGAAKALIMVIRPEADRDITAPNATNEYYNYTQIDTWQWTAADVTIFDLLDDRYCRFYINEKYFPGVPGDFIYVAPLGAAPANYKHGTGHKTVTGMTNPLLTINFASALAVNQRVDLYLLVNNNIQHHKSELYKTFN